MKKNIIVIIVLVLTIDVFSQSLNQCAFDEVGRYFNDSNGNYYAQQNKADIVWWNYWRSKNNSNLNFGNESNVQRRSSCTKAKLIIPVAIHVVHNGGSENIGYSQAQNAIDNLNKHFANGLGTTDPLAVNTGIRFLLVKFDKVQSSLTIHRKIKQTGQLMGLKMASTDTFINVWVVKQILDTAGKDIGVMGYSTYPGRVFAGGKQGVVIRFDWFGKADPSLPINSESRGDFLTHEIGHYLGLYHPFEGGCTGLKSSTAYSEGDYCLDVPAVSYADTNCLGNNNSCVEEYNLLSYG